MEMYLRIVLFLLGVTILVLVIWDAIKRQTKRKHFKRPIIEPNFILEDGEEPVPSVPLVQKEIPKKQICSCNEQDIIAVYVIAREPKGFAGEKLFKALNSANLKYGKMNIFHYYVKSIANEEILFSAASAVEPGRFDLKKINKQYIKGITLFMILPKIKKPTEAFDLLIRTAKQLAFTLNGELLDQDHKPLTLQIVQDYKRKVITC